MGRVMVNKKGLALAFTGILILFCLGAGVLGIGLTVVRPGQPDIDWTSVLSQQSSGDDTNSTNGTMSPLCTVLCCISFILIIVVFIALIVFIIIMIGKVNKKTDTIAQQAKTSGASPPPQRQGTPPQQTMAVQQQPMRQQGMAQAQAGTAAAAGGGTWAQQIFVGDSFRVDMKILHFGYSYFIYDAWNRQIAYCFMKPIKFKEDIRVFTDDTKSYEIMTIQQEQIIDFSGSFQVWDSMSKQFLGILKRQGFKSFIKDEWSILNFNRQEVGHIKEDSTGMALARRFVPYGGWIPNASFINYQGRDIAVIKEKFRVIGNEYYIHMVPGTQNLLDRRLAVACVLMMAMFETRKGR